MKKIILFSGDPNSINTEILIKSWKKISKSLKKKIATQDDDGNLHRTLDDSADGCTGGVGVGSEQMESATHEEDRNETHDMQAAAHGNNT